ncbi:MAG TPA: hypothetical protein VJU77_01650 [Chthoniobacterales bacterium]|nr:hypothetical protein [Chthoniobacterales bacterium]
MTPLSALIAIIVVCFAAISLMMFVMILASPTPAWYRRLNFGSIVFGVFMVAFGVFNLFEARENERTHRLSYYRGSAPVTPAQSYAIGILCIGLGTFAVLSAIVHRRSSSGGS